MTIQRPFFPQCPCVILFASIICRTFSYTVYFCSMSPRKFCSDAAKMDIHTKTARKGMGLRWRQSSEILHLLLTKLCSLQKPYKLHAISRKRDLRKYSNSWSYCFHSPLHIIRKSLDSKNWGNFLLKKSILKSSFPIMSLRKLLQ
jgi:hypothetical protein